MNLFQLGEFKLNSGAISKWKLECDFLTPSDIEALAHMIRLMVGPFSEVTGVPRGGLALAAALEKYRVPLKYDRVLIADDVLTTGGSMIRHRDSVVDKYHESSDFVGAVVFARGQCLHWIKAVFQMPECFWIEPLKR